MPSGSGTILLVEDEEMLLWMTTLKLGGDGIQGDPCNKHRRLRLISAKKGEQEIDLILTDVVMPDVNGREMVERDQD